MAPVAASRSLPSISPASPLLPEVEAMQATDKRTAAEALRADLATLPTDWRLVRVGPDKAPIAGDGWFDVDDYSPDDAASLNGSMPPAWGLKSGPASGALVLDLDSPGWRESFQEVTGHPITDLPSTIGWSSGKPERSAHAFAVDPDWWPYLRNRVNFTRPWREGDPLSKDGKKRAVTIWELRWDRHQSVLIGAHPETGAYRWLPGRSPADIPEPALAPDWLLDALIVQEIADTEPIEPTAEDADRAVAMLSHLPPADFTAYDDWLRVGMALHHTDPGLLVPWVDWCRSMANFDEAECLKKWESFGKGHRGRPASIATLHHLAKGYGYREPKRSRKATASATGPQQQQDATRKAKVARFVPRADSRARWGSRKLSHSRAMECFDRCVQVQAAKERNSLRRRARLLKAAADLGLSKYINRQELAQRVLEAKDQQEGRTFATLSAADRVAMERPRVQFLVPGLVPERDATILGGRAKVGKTRLAMAIAAALLNGSGLFDLGAPTPRDVILVSDDQADGDTADMLDALGIWDHPRLIWSRHFRLTENDLEALLQTVKAHPGALVILDSLRSIGRSLQHGENDPELGVMLYDLKGAVTEAGGTLLLIHHCNKSEGLIGVEALSGHNAIAGAANGILTLHYLPDDKGRPRKDDPQRRLVREARSGQGFDLVVSPLAGTGTFYRVGTFADWQRQQDESKAEQKANSDLRPGQQQALEVLADDGGWLTRRQVCDALGVKWVDRGRNSEAQKVRRALDRLVELGMAESERTGIEATWRASHGTQLGESLMTVMPPSDAKGSGVITPFDATDDHFTDGGTTASLSSLDRIAETEGHDREASLSSPIRAGEALPGDEALIDRLIAARQQNPGDAPSSLALVLDPDGALGITGRKVKDWLAHPAVQARIAGPAAA